MNAHWFLTLDKAVVTVGDVVKSLNPDQSAYLLLGKVHRLNNRGKESVVLIEVQFGNYLGEDDIVRLEDMYNRGNSDLI